MDGWITWNHVKLSSKLQVIEYLRKPRKAQEMLAFMNVFLTLSTHAFFRKMEEIIQSLEVA